MATHRVYLRAKESMLDFLSCKAILQRDGIVHIDSVACRTDVNHVEVE